MQVSYLDIEQLADMLNTGERLTTLDHPTQQVHVLHWGGVDLLAVVDPVTGGAVVVSPCDQDGDSGGSIHHHARQTFVTT